MKVLEDLPSGWPWSCCCHPTLVWHRLRSPHIRVRKLNHGNDVCVVTVLPRIRAVEHAKGQMKHSVRDYCRCVAATRRKCSK